MITAIDNLVWYLPSWYGDIRLETTEDGKTKVTWFKLSGAEVFAMGKLREKSVGVRTRWTDKEAWDRIPLRSFEPGDPAETSIVLDGRIDKVEGVLTRALKPERKTLRVVRIAGGSIEEIHDREFDQAAIEAKHPYTAIAKREETKPEKPAAVATTVAAPVRGCPAPDFEKVHSRATAVLKAFLTPEQTEDFDRYQRFIVTGADTGHRYMITSRNAPEELQTYTRTVYDLDERVPYCVHDWAIPAEEEVLTMGLLLQLPNRESWMREIPDPLAGGGAQFVCGPMPA